MNTPIQHRVFVELFDLPFEEYPRQVVYLYCQDWHQFEEDRDPQGIKIREFAHKVAQRAAKKFKLSGKLFCNDSDGRGSFEFGISTEETLTQLFVYV